MNQYSNKWICEKTRIQTFDIIKARFSAIRHIANRLCSGAVIDSLYWFNNEQNDWVSQNTSNLLPIGFDSLNYSIKDACSVWGEIHTLESQKYEINRFPEEKWQLEIKKISFLDNLPQFLLETVTHLRFRKKIFAGLVSI